MRGAAHASETEGSYWGGGEGVVKVDLINNKFPSTPPRLALCLIAPY